MCIRDRDGISEDGDISEEAQEMVQHDLRAHFRPEFLNRLDEIILFKPLTKDNIGHIVDLLVADLNKRLAGQELSIELTPEAKEFVIDGGYDPVYGARPLKRFIQKYVETLSLIHICIKCLAHCVVPGVQVIRYILGRFLPAHRDDNGQNIVLCRFQVLHCLQKQRGILAVSYTHLDVYKRQLYC